MPVPVSRSASFADSTISTGDGRPLHHPTVARGCLSAGMYSSMMRWAFDPPAPKEETPGDSWILPDVAINLDHEAAAMPPTPAGPQRASRSKSILGFKGSVWSEGASWRCLSCSRTLVTPAMPAAPSQCPILDLTEPMAQKCRSPV